MNRNVLLIGLLAFAAFAYFKKKQEVNENGEVIDNGEIPGEFAPPGNIPPDVTIIEDEGVKPVGTKSEELIEGMILPEAIAAESESFYFSNDDLM